MGHLGRFTKTPYLVLFIILASIGISTVYAVTITLSGDPVIINGILDMMNNRVTNVGTPTNPSDAATKEYVDSLFSCDGAGESCVVGLGECQNSGINVCMMGSTQCSASAGASSPEICDSFDNDCDGTSDEDFPTVGDSCSVGLGICQSNGNLVCSQDKTAVECDAVPGIPQTEICNTRDDDCNGLVDDNCPICDPLNPEPACGANMQCFPRQVGNPLCFGPTGTGTQGDLCANNQDCDTTFACFTFNLDLACRQWCTQTSDCPLGNSCFLANLFIQGQEWGICAIPP